MKNLIFSLVVVGLIGAYLWHFDPAKIQRNIQKNIPTDKAGKMQRTVRCALDKADYLIGCKRVPHTKLDPVEVALKHAMATAIYDFDVVRETVAQKEEIRRKRRKLTKEERKARKKALRQELVYTATLESLIGDKAKVHLIQSVNDSESDMWLNLDKTNCGWCVVETATNDY